MRCPVCNNKRSRIYRTECVRGDDGGYVRRRRECPSCSERWTTYERFEDSDTELAFRASEVASEMKALAEKLLCKTG